MNLASSHGQRRACTKASASMLPYSPCHWSQRVPLRSREDTTAKPWTGTWACQIGLDCTTLTTLISLGKTSLIQLQKSLDKGSMHDFTEFLLMCIGTDMTNLQQMLSDSWFLSRCLWISRNLPISQTYFGATLPQV